MNTGAILNRINFGLAAAAGRLPGVDIRDLPALDTIRSAPREKQVDAVVAAILNGMVSPDTRAVLLPGDPRHRRRPGHLPSHTVPPHAGVPMEEKRAQRHGEDDPLLAAALVRR